MPRKPERERRDAPRPIGEILESLIPDEDPHVEVLRKTLLDSLSPTEREQIHEITERRGVLRVVVRSSCLMHELRAFRYEELLHILQAATDAVTIRKIYFSQDLRAN